MTDSTIILHGYLILYSPNAKSRALQYSMDSVSDPERHVFCNFLPRMSGFSSGTTCEPSTIALLMSGDNALISSAKAGSVLDRRHVSIRVFECF